MFYAPEVERFVLLPLPTLSCSCDSLNWGHGNYSSPRGVVRLYQSRCHRLGVTNVGARLSSIEIGADFARYTTHASRVPLGRNVWFGYILRVHSQRVNRTQTRHQGQPPPGTRGRHRSKERLTSVQHLYGQHIDFAIYKMHSALID